MGQNRLLRMPPPWFLGFLREFGESEPPHA
jgi:hypothetical protein